MNIHKFSRFDPAQPIFLFSPADDGAGLGSGTGNNADDNAGGGNEGGANNGDVIPNTDSNNSETRKAEIESAVEAKIKQLLGGNNGDERATLADVVKKLHGVEKQRDEARASALSGNDRKAFEAFKALNLSAADVKNIVAEHSSWKTERSNSAKTDALKKAAQVAGLNAELLQSLQGSLDVEYVVTGEGDAATATVKSKDASGAETVRPLEDWAKEKWPALEKALKASGSSIKTVTTYGKSAPVGGGGKVSLKEQILAEEKAKSQGGKTESENAAPKAQSLDERLGRTRRI